MLDAIGIVLYALVVVIVGALLATALVRWVDKRWP